MNNKISILFLLLGVFILTSCSRWISPHRILQVSPSSELHSIDNLHSKNEHIIVENDELNLFVMANNAEILLNPELGQAIQVQNEIIAKVNKDGYVNFPGIEPLKLSGLSITEAEEALKAQYSYILNNPYVKLNITNKRVVVYNNLNQGGQVVNIQNYNTTLLEAITIAGGITQGRAYQIYLHRNEKEKNKTYKIDISTVENLKLAQIIVQSNDIIIVNSRHNISRRTLEEIAPIISLTTTLLLIINLFK